MHTRKLLRKSRCYCHGGLLLPSGYKCLQEDAPSAVFSAHTLIVTGCVSLVPCSAVKKTKISASDAYTDIRALARRVVLKLQTLNLTTQVRGRGCFAAPPGSCLVTPCLDPNTSK